MKMDVPKPIEAIILKALASRSNRYGHIRQMSEGPEKFYRQRSIKFKIRDLSNVLKRLVSLQS